MWAFKPGTCGLQPHAPGSWYCFVCTLVRVCVCVCLCVCVSVCVCVCTLVRVRVSMSPASATSQWLGTGNVFWRQKYSHKFGARLLSPGRRLMAPLSTRHSCAPAEVLRASQGVFHQKSAQRAKTAVLTASTWNIRSMVDTGCLHVGMCVCLSVCLPLRELITSGVIWCDIDRVWLVT